MRLQPVRWVILPRGIKPARRWTCRSARVKPLDRRPAEPSHLFDRGTRRSHSRAEAVTRGEPDVTSITSPSVRSGVGCQPTFRISST